MVDYPFARLGLAVWPFVFLAALVAPRAQCIGPLSASLREQSRKRPT